MKKITKLLAVSACVLFTGGPAANAEDYVWKFVSAGDATSHAIRSDGALYGWGWNEKGQAANGTSERSATPTLVDAGMKWKKVVSGKSYTFYLAEDGSLWASGTAEGGVQGTGDGKDHKVITRIGTDNDWVDVACPRFWGYNGFAVKADGTLWSWGKNESGQLGIGSSQSKQYPTQVGTDTDWKQVAAGSMAVLAVKTDNTLWGWGFNMKGELFGLPSGKQDEPARLGADADWVMAVSIDERGYAVKTDGSLWAWGDNSDNLLGLDSPTKPGVSPEGNPIEIVVPSQIDAPTKVQAIEGKVVNVSGCEKTLSVATGADGLIDKIWMFGSNDDGALGDGNGKGHDNDDIPFATKPVHPSLKSGLKFAMMCSGQKYTLVLTDDGDIWGWGSNRGGQLGDETPADQLQVSYKLKPILVNCPQEDVSGIESPKKGKAVPAVSFDGRVLALQLQDGEVLASGRVYDMNGTPVMVLAASATAWDVSALPQGVYVAGFTVGGASVTYKFAVK